jgi:hypothetical protein
MLKSQKIEKPNKFLGAVKSKGLNRIAKISYGYLCQRKENISVNNNYIILDL